MCQNEPSIKKKILLSILKPMKNQHVQAGDTSLHFTVSCLVQFLAKMSYATFHRHFVFLPKNL